MNWLKKLRVHLRPYLLLAAIAIATAKIEDVLALEEGDPEE